MLASGLEGTVLAQSPAGSPEAPVIQAQGEATVTRPPDVAWVQIAVEARAAKPDDARQRDAAAMTLVVAAIKAVVAADAVKTSVIAVQPEMDYSAGGPRVSDYVARNQIEVRVDDLARLPKVIDVGMASGATSLSGLRFDVKNRAEVQLAALRLAVQDAMAHAEAMAAGAGRALGPLVRIQEQCCSPSQGVAYRLSGGAGGGRGGGAPIDTPVTPGDIEVRSQVIVTIAVR
jgi:uncharacterized protein YggE